MKIVRFVAENIKRLTAVEINPEGNVIELTGENGAGKTSILDAIWWAVTGTRNIQTSPLRDGCEEALIHIDLGSLKITRRFHAKAPAFTTTLVVENADGSRFQGPQEVLNNLLGALTFDPLEFARMKPKEQFNLLRAFVPGVDFNAIADANKADFDKRRDINRDVASLRAQAEAIVLAPDSPSEAIDEDALVQQLDRAGAANAELEARRGRRETSAQSVITLLQAAQQRAQRAGDLREQISRMEAEARALDEASASATDEARGIQAQLDAAPPLPEPVDTAEIAASISDARRHNQLVAQRERRAGLLKEASKLEKQSDDLTRAMTEREAGKIAAIAAAKMPVQGITFGDEIVLLNGQPFDQASDAEQLRASIAIAMASDPKLRVIRVRDGSLLSRASFKILEDMAEANDIQVWIETVESTRPSAILIEDGHVAGMNLREAAE